MKMSILVVLCCEGCMSVAISILLIILKKPTHDSTAHLLKNRLNSLKIWRVGRISDAHTCANVTAVHTLSPSHTTSVDSENELSYDSARKQNRKYMLYNR